MNAIRPTIDEYSSSSNSSIIQSEPRQLVADLWQFRWTWESCALSDAIAIWDRLSTHRHRQIWLHHFVLMRWIYIWQIHHISMFTCSRTHRQIANANKRRGGNIGAHLGDFWFLSRPNMPKDKYWHRHYPPRIYCSMRASIEYEPWMHRRGTSRKSTENATAAGGKSNRHQDKNIKIKFVFRRFDFYAISVECVLCVWYFLIQHYSIK